LIFSAIGVQSTLVSVHLSQKLSQSLVNASLIAGIISDIIHSSSLDSSLLTTSHVSGSLTSLTLLVISSDTSYLANASFHLLNGFSYFSQSIRIDTYFFSLYTPVFRLMLLIFLSNPAGTYSLNKIFLIVLHNFIPHLIELFSSSSISNVT
jgi:hypothetical protein